MKLKSLVFLAPLVMATYSQALELEYAGFYNYLKAANQVDYNRVRPAFYLSNPAENKPCWSDRSAIKATGQSYPLQMNRISGEFFVPFDKRLKDSRSTLWFDVPETCQLQIGVVGKLEGQSITAKDLLVTAQQMYDLMGAFAGMVKFMMPEWRALVFHNADGETFKVERAQLKGEGIELPWPATHVRLEMAAKP